MGGRQTRESRRRTNSQYRAANLERERQRSRDSYRANRDVRIQKAREYALAYLSLKKQAIFEFWQRQDGRCYLCEEPVALESAVLEHDHRCCPRGRFCRYCVRGAACYSCNIAIGHAKDDPERLERLARNLRIKQALVTVAISERPEQMLLFPEGGAAKFR